MTENDVKLRNCLVRAAQALRSVGAIACEAGVAILENRPYPPDAAPAGTDAVDELVAAAEYACELFEANEGADDWWRQFGDPRLARLRAALHNLKGTRR